MKTANALLAAAAALAFATAASAVAETDCALLAMNRNVFLSLVKSEPAFGIALLSAMAERLRNTAAALN